MAVNLNPTELPRGYKIVAEGRNGGGVFLHLSGLENGNETIASLDEVQAADDTYVQKIVDGLVQDAIRDSTPLNRVQREDARRASEQAGKDAADRLNG